MRKISLILSILLCSFNGLAQFQTLRGKITEKETNQPIQGAKVSIITLVNDSSLTAISNAQGE